MGLQKKNKETRLQGHGARWFKQAKAGAGLLGNKGIKSLYEL